MKGGVRLWCETWHHIRISTLHGLCQCFGKWWGREVVTKGVWWLWEAVTKGSGDEEKWWGREVVTKRSGDEGSVVTLHHIRMHSMKGGVRQWCETLHSTKDTKAGERLWCETWHHITIHSMKGGVRLWLWCETLHHITIRSTKGGVRLCCDTWHHITLNLPLVHKNVYHFVSPRFQKMCPFKGLKKKGVRSSVALHSNQPDSFPKGSIGHFCHALMHVQHAKYDLEQPRLTTWVASQHM